MKLSRILSLINIFFISLPLFSQGIIIDHKCTDISKIPDFWINQVKSLIKLHYAHTSHGSQLTKGIERLANPSLPVYDPRLKFKLEERKLPSSLDLCIMDGQLHESYVISDMYWRNGGDSHTRKTLNTYATINVSMFSWCTEVSYYSEGYMKNEYLKIMSRLEQDYPNVTFIYMTGNAQKTGELGYNRHLRNEQIREYCRKNNKVLFDFGDLDTWYNGEQSTYDYNGQKIPKEHPYYKGNECMHTTFESCENKGRALWWLLARIVGWKQAKHDYNSDGIAKK